MNKVKSSRARLGFSQEELAQRTGLSLRTIQRIENGETTPRGDSLRRLHEALGISMEELHEDRTEKILEENRGLLVALHLSALAFLAPWPGLGVIVPLILWLLVRDKIAGADKAGRRILKFQIIWLSVTGILFLTVAVFKILHMALPFELTPARLWLWILITDGYNISHIVAGAIRANKKGSALRENEVFSRKSEDPSNKSKGSSSLQQG
jgi:transcriptional regulator with XRE-family HTH domain